MIITVSALLLAAGAAAAVYFLAFDSLALVTDNAFMQVMPSGTIGGLRMSLVGKGMRLKVVKLSDDTLNSSGLFSSTLAALKDDYIVLTPVSAAYAVNNEIDVSELKPSSVVLAVHDESALRYFDCTLVSDEMSGWEKASEAIGSETASMSQNIGLVYDEKGRTLAQGIVSCFPDGHVTEFERVGASKLFASNTLGEMDRLGIVLAMCPYVGGFSEFFGSESSVSWITDYRLAQVVTEGKLYGIVLPDFRSLADIARRTQKGDHSSVGLEYVYEKK